MRVALGQGGLRTAVASPLVLGWLSRALAATASLAQRRQADLQHAQPVIEILAGGLDCS